jgi:hypothetical protein
MMRTTRPCRVNSNAAVNPAGPAPTISIGKPEYIDCQFWLWWFRKMSIVPRSGVPAQAFGAESLNHS